jgi:hypothetical protein
MTMQEQHYIRLFRTKQPSTVKAGEAITSSQELGTKSVQNFSIWSGTLLSWIIVWERRPWRTGALAHWGPGALGPWRTGALAHWGPVALGPCRTGALAHWGPGALGPWSTGALEHWGPGALGPWSTGALEHWGPWHLD